jgi:hypothetical protein
MRRCEREDWHLRRRSEVEKQLHYMDEARYPRADVERGRPDRSGHRHLPEFLPADSVLPKEHDPRLTEGVLASVMRSKNVDPHGFVAQTPHGDLR